METAHDFFAFLRREVALNVWDNKKQKLKQHKDFQYIIDKKLNAAANPTRHIKAKWCKYIAD